MKEGYRLLGDFIRQVDVRNTDGKMCIRDSILNPEKTDEKLLVSSYGCASETAAREFEWTRKIAEQKGMNPVRIIARHVIQSFEIGEVTPCLLYTSCQSHTSV